MPYERKSAVGRPFRRLRRWFNSTPNDRVAGVLISLGVTFLFIAVGVAVLAK